MMRVILITLYDSYPDGKLTLGRNEVFQIGFRLGKLLGIKRLSCVDEQGGFYGYLDTLFSDSARAAGFEEYYYHNPDSLIREGVFRILRCRGHVSEIIGNSPDTWADQPAGAYYALSGSLLHGGLQVRGEAGRFHRRRFRNLQVVRPQPPDLQEYPAHNG